MRYGAKACSRRFRRRHQSAHSGRLGGKSVVARLSYVLIMQAAE